jgi:hypothetical protein
MIPIILGLSTNQAIVRTDLLFSESAIINDNYASIVKSSFISEYEMKYTGDQFIRFKFSELYKKWYSNTMFYSSPKMIIEDENFLGIVNMGEPVIPYILKKIEDEPSQLVWALNIITHKSISPNSLVSISDSCKSWVKYGKLNII